LTINIGDLNIRTLYLVVREGVIIAVIVELQRKSTVHA